MGTHSTCAAGRPPAFHSHVLGKQIPCSKQNKKKKKRTKKESKLCENNWISLDRSKHTLLNIDFLGNFYIILRRKNKKQKAGTKKSRKNRLFKKSEILPEKVCFIPKSGKIKLSYLKF